MKSCGESIIQQDGVLYSPVPAGMSNFCNGRLTLSSGTPVLTTDVTAATTVYFTPYNGNFLSLYDPTSTTWHSSTFSELSLSIGGYTANTNYDVFVSDVGTGSPTLSATAWFSDTLRSVELSTQNGVRVKSNKHTLDGFSSFNNYYDVYNTGVVKIGQAFTLNTTSTISGVKFYVKRSGTITGDMTAYLYVCTGTPGSTGVPTGSALAVSSGISSATVSSSNYEWVEFTFTSPYTASSGNYCVVFTFSGGSGVDVDIKFGESDSGGHAGNLFYYVSSYVAAAGSDACFQLLATVTDATAPAYRYLGTFRTNDSEVKAQYNQSNKNLDELIYSPYSYQGQAFNLASGATLTGASFYLSKVGSPTGSAYFRLYACSGSPGTNGVPTGSLLATTAAFDVSTLSSSSYTMLRLNFTTPYVAASGNYCLYVDYNGGDINNGIYSGWGSANKTGNTFAWNSSAWSVGTTYNACFYLWGYSVATTEVSFGRTPAAGGSAPKCFVSNNYNRVGHSFQILDSTDTWTWNTNAWRQRNNSAANQFAFVSGTGNMNIEAINIAFGYGSSQLYSGFGYDAVNALAPGCVSYVGGYNAHAVGMPSSFSGIPIAGYHFLAPLENSYSDGSYVGDGGDSSLFQSGAVVHWDY